MFVGFMPFKLIPPAPAEVAASCMYGMLGEQYPAPSGVRVKAAEDFDSIRRRLEELRVEREKTLREEMPPFQEGTL